MSKPVMGTKGDIRDSGNLPENWFGNQPKEQPGRKQDDERIGYTYQEVLSSVFTLGTGSVEEQTQQSRGRFPRWLQRGCWEELLTMTREK